MVCGYVSSIEMPACMYVSSGASSVPELKIEELALKLLVDAELAALNPISNSDGRLRPARFLFPFPFLHTNFFRL